MRALAVAAIVTCTVPQISEAQCSAADKAALETFDKKWSTATRDGDEASLRTMLADSYMAVNIINTVDKATTIANAVRNAAARKANANPAPAGVGDRFLISCTAGSATITHRNTNMPAAGSTAAPTYGRSVHFLEKRGNQWQFVSSTGHQLTDQQQLVYLEMDWNDATRAHSSDWVDQNYAPFATDVSSRTGAIENKEQASSSMKTDKRVFESLELSDLTTRVEGDVGVVTGVNHAVGKDGEGKPMDRKIRFTDTFIKKDGKWQVWATQGTVIQ